MFVNKRAFLNLSHQCFNIVISSTRLTMIYKYVARLAVNSVDKFF